MWTADWDGSLPFGRAAPTVLLVSRVICGTSVQKPRGSCHATSVAETGKGAHGRRVRLPTPRLAEPDQCASARARRCLRQQPAIKSTRVLLHLRIAVTG
jgi:hypothetical protein